MTENKRYSLNWKNGHPNFWDNHCDLADCYLTCGDAVNILNELSDENEQLKQYKQSVNDVLKSWSQKNLTAKQLQVVLAIMEELNVIGDVE